MSLGTRVSGAWKNISAVSVRVNGAWKTCKQVYVKVSGTWKPCILSTTTKTINLGTLTEDKTQSISNVKNGSTIKITGHYSTGGSGGRLLGLKATGATLPSNYGAYDGNGWRYYNDITNTDYTLNLTATSTSVSITIRAPAFDGSHTNCKITYTEEGYFD